MTMTPTDRPQRPRECEHWNQRLCYFGTYTRPCVHNCPIAKLVPMHCPDYEPKEEKDNENK